MERLTKSDVFADFAIKEMIPIDMNRLSHMYHRLRLYEETGITPEEFAVINQEYTRMARELSILRGRNRWIPCSERLPEVEADVLLSLRNLDIYIGFRANKDECFYVEGGEYIKYENVLAWRPLPEPYKG